MALEVPVLLPGSIDVNDSNPRRLNFTPKSVSLAAPSGSPHEIVVEVPRGLPNQRQSHLLQ